MFLNKSSRVPHHHRLGWMQLQRRDEGVPEVQRPASGSPGRGVQRLVREGEGGAVDCQASARAHVLVDLRAGGWQVGGKWVAGCCISVWMRQGSQLKFYLPAQQAGRGQHSLKVFELAELQSHLASAPGRQPTPGAHPTHLHRLSCIHVLRLHELQEGRRINSTERGECAWKQKVLSQTAQLLLLPTSPMGHEPKCPPPPSSCLSSAGQCAHMEV